VIGLLAAIWASALPPVQLHRTDTQRAGSVPFDLAPDELREAEIADCRVEETLPMGAGVAEKRRCQGRLDAETAQKRCKQAARHNALPPDVTPESCLTDYQRGAFLFRGELKEVIIARRRDRSPILAFDIREGDVLSTFSAVGDAVLVGVGGGSRVRYAVISTRGLLRAPPLGDEAVDVEVSRGRIRVTGKARAMQVDLVPENGRLRVEKK
jgi:hypothetical protein